MSEGHASYSILNKFVRRECFTCGDEYFISKYAQDADTGRCVSCDQEISDLEKMFNDGVTP
jgi:DNA-directed RNA polymerase subunit N (RpoN/RPB10)